MNLFRVSDLEFRILRFLVCVFYFLFLVFGFSWSWGDSIEITKIEAKRDRGLDYLDIYTTGNIKAQGLLLEDQLVISFPNSTFAEDLEISKRESERIKDIQVKQISGEAAQIVIDLGKDIDYEIVNVFGRNKSVVEISDRLDYTERLMAEWEKRNLITKGEELKPYKYDPILTGKDRSLRGKTIVINPGHGGKDPGALSLSGIPEKHLTLATARKIAARLSAAGAAVYLTRNEDLTCNLKDIVDFANRIKADLFISVHYNYVHKKSISGTETYYYHRKSRNLALAVHQSLVYGIKRKDRGLRRARFYAVYHTQMPAVLVEPLFISNSKEERLASSPGFQDEIARDIAKGVKAYFRSKTG